jgi:hypothetical protein
MIFMKNYKFRAMKPGLIAITIFASMFALSASAQNQNMERLNSYKIAFFTKRLNLTPQEAEKFWPVYNGYQEMKNKLQAERQEINRNFSQNELNMTDKEMTDAGDRLVAIETREASLAQDFHNKIKGILSPVKVLRLYQAENQYRLMLLKELQERRQERTRNLRR